MNLIPLVITLIVTLSTQVDAKCPKIISRSKWGAAPPKSTTGLSVRPAPYYVIHHSAGASCSSKASCMTEVRNIQSRHMKTEKWDDIGYNFLIGGDGRVYKGRGWKGQGAHAPGFNIKSIGICFIGNFMNRKPTNAALKAAKALIQCGVKLGHVKKNYSLIGHRQANPTDCPGSSLFKEIKKWRKFKSGKFF